MTRSLYERAEDHYGYHMQAERERQMRRRLPPPPVPQGKPHWVKLLSVLAFTVFAFICMASCGFLTWQIFFTM